MFDFLLFINVYRWTVLASFSSWWLSFLARPPLSIQMTTSCWDINLHEIGLPARLSDLPDFGLQCVEAYRSHFILRGGCIAHLLHLVQWNVIVSNVILGEYRKLQRVARYIFQPGSNFPYLINYFNNLANLGNDPIPWETAEHPYRRCYLFS